MTKYNWAYVSTVAILVLENILILGGTGYAVFGLGASGWWFALAVLCLNSLGSQ